MYVLNKKSNNHDRKYVDTKLRCDFNPTRIVNLIYLLFY